jgi:hypothetical protein
MADRMDQLVTAAECQDFTVRRTAKGAWVFTTGTLIVTEAHTAHPRGAVGAPHRRSARCRLDLSRNRPRGVKPT